MPTYIVASSRKWNKRTFDEKIAKLSGTWIYVDEPAGLEINRLEGLSPRMIFFLHWSDRVPDEVITRYECVGFHMSDVPYGRGGSPLQNLIIRGHRRTTLTALRLVAELDAGPVYLKEDLCLEGLAEEIFMRASALAANMINRIISEGIEPVPQTGQPTLFRRRRPEESRMPACNSLEELFDFLRMLDAEGYPRAFLIHNSFRFEFSRPALYDGRVVADVKITHVPEGAGS